jgi:hypothetical protein
MSVDGPRRLLDYGDDLNGTVRDALEAERADDVSAARLERIARAMAAASPAPSAGPPPVAPAPETAPSGGGWMASHGPYVLLAAAVMGAFLAIRATSHHEVVPAAAPAVASAPSERRAPPTQSTSASPVEPEPPIATLSPSDLPTARTARVVESPPMPAAAAPARAVKTTTAASTDADEIALLARAHDALRSDPARSVALCREHETRFAAGHFAQEREAVAIEALVYLGKKDQARRRWNAFRERYPSSSHRVHLETLFAAPAAP